MESHLNIHVRLLGMVLVEESFITQHLQPYLLRFGMTGPWHPPQSNPFETVRYDLEASWVNEPSTVDPDGSSLRQCLRHVESPRHGSHGKDGPAPFRCHDIFDMERPYLRLVTSPWHGMARERRKTMV